ncbi:hypothetical protein GW17_00007912 [Ensete ventricosum]|nr:hypothetical protein GW17_00007912 [Ensete ventricosum]
MARPTSTVSYRATSLRAFSGGCTPCGAVQYNPRRPGFGLLLCVSSRCHVGTDTVIVLTPRGYLPSANPAQPVVLLLLIATHLDLGCAGGRKVGESTMDERIPSPAYFQYSPSGVHSSPSPHHSIRSPASSDRERSATPPPCCNCCCFCRYLAELLAERQKLGPFMQVLPFCNRLLNQVTIDVAEIMRASGLAPNQAFVDPERIEHGSPLRLAGHASNGGPMDLEGWSGMQAEVMPLYLSIKARFVISYRTDVLSSARYDKKPACSVKPRRHWRGFAPSYVAEASRPRFFSRRSPKLILLTKPCRDFFSPRATNRDHRGRVVPNLQVVPFLLPLLPSLSVDTARQRAATVEIDCYRLISDGNGVVTTPIGGIACMGGTHRYCKP